MRYILLAVCLATQITAASTTNGDGDNKSQVYIDKTREDIGTRHIKDGTQADDERGQIDDNYFDSVIYTDIFVRSSNGVKYNPSGTRGIGDKIALHSPASDHAKFIQAVMKAEAEANATSSQKKIAYFAGGFCTVKTPLNISKSNEYTTLDCVLDFGNRQFRRVDIFAGVYPDYRREMIIGIPLYATFENQQRANFDGVVMNEIKSSINIADWTDNKRIRKLLAESALAANDIAYRHATDYMKALQASRMSQSVQYVKTTDSNGTSVTVPVVTTESAKPEIKDYLWSAGIEFLTKIFSIGGKSYLYNTYPLFKLMEGKRVYVEGIVTFDKDNLSRKFGLLQQSEVKRTSTNNQHWQNEKQRVINSYGETNVGTTGMPINTGTLVK